MTSSTMTAAKGAFRDRLERTGQQTGAPLRAFFLFLFFFAGERCVNKKKKLNNVCFFLHRHAISPSNFTFLFRLDPYAASSSFLFGVTRTHAGSSGAGPRGRSHLKERLPNEGENLFYRGTGGAGAIKTDCIYITHALIKDVIDINKETSARPI